MSQVNVDKTTLRNKLQSNENIPEHHLHNTPAHTRDDKHFT